MKSPVVTCLRRWDTLWGLALVGGMGNAFFQLSRGLIERVEWLSPDPAVADLSAAGARTLGGFAVALGLGMIMSGVLQELWTASAMRSATGLRRRVRRELAGLSWALGALMVLGAAVSGGLAGAVAWPLLPLGLVAGLVIFDPRMLGVGTFGALLAVVAVGLGVEWALALAPEVQLAATAATAGGAGFVLAYLTGQRNQDATLIQQLDGKLNVHRNPLDIQPFERALKRGSLRDARWARGPIRTQADHIRALDFERWGWARPGWPFGRLGATGFVLLLVVLSAIGLSWFPTELPRGASSLVAELLGQPHLLADATLNRTWLVANVYPGLLFAALLVVNDRLMPSFPHARHYPLGRQARARILFAGSVRAWLRTLAPLALGSAALWLAAMHLSETPFSPAPPVFLIALVASLAALPLFQVCASLRETRGPKSGPPWVSVTWMILLLSGACAVIFVITTAALKSSPGLAWVTLAVVAAVAALGQLAFRHYLFRRIQTLEL